MYYVCILINKFHFEKAYSSTKETDCSIAYYRRIIIKKKKHQITILKL